MENKQLSKSFTLDEFVASQTASRLWIDNTPPESVIKELENLCKTILQPARDALGPILVTSGYRSPRLNRAVGSRETSGHKLGYCADIIPIQVSRLALVDWLVKNVKFDQILLEFGTENTPAWIHVSSDPRLRGQVLRTLDGKKFTEYKGT